MSEAVTLTVRTALDRPLEMEGVTPDRCASLSEREIAALPVRYGGRPGTLGDFFTVKGERAARLRIEGEAGRVDGIGAGMAGGELIALGDVGRDAGVGMAGGTIEIRGSAGDNAGGALPGASRGMTGGEIIIRGTAGVEAGAQMRRGLIVVAGDAGPAAGRGMIAGTAVVLGAAGPGAGRFVKRGTIVALGALEPPATFRYACTYQPPHLRLLLGYLRAQYGLPVADRHVTGRYHRYSGDLAELGKGEILQWAG